jgi:carbon starvation protein CstA
MSTQVIVIIAAVLALVVALAMRRSGPRVTTIEHKVERHDPAEDE